MQELVVRGRFPFSSSPVVPSRSLPCDICLKNRNAQEVIEPNCRVRLSHSKNCSKTCAAKFHYIITDKKTNTSHIQKSLCRLYATVVTEKDRAKFRTRSAVCQSVLVETGLQQFDIC